MKQLQRGFRRHIVRRALAGGNGIAASLRILIKVISFLQARDYQ
jgi:hypothetical protein